MRLLFLEREKLHLKMTIRYYTYSVQLWLKQEIVVARECW